MVQVFTTHIRPIIDFVSVLWNTGYVGDLQLLESVQRRWTKEINGLSNFSYTERLSSLNLHSIKGRLLRADLVMVWKILNGHCPHLAHLFTSVGIDRTRGHSKKLFKHDPSLSGLLGLGILFLRRLCRLLPCHHLSEG